MSEFLCMRGETALSAFRLQKLQQRIQSACGISESPEARFVYLVELNKPLAKGKVDWLESLVHGRPVRELDATGLALVIPRIGTLSPWSSKATDIAGRCHLEEVMRIERGVAFSLPILSDKLGEIPANICDLLHDRMTQTVVNQLHDAWALFAHREPARLERIPVASQGLAALEACNLNLGLALSPDEMEYLRRAFIEMGRDPSDAELMMFAQANSEHCRHKIFNAEFTLDGATQDRSLFAMIRNTHASSPDGILSAYHDNSAVIEGPAGKRFLTDPDSGSYGWREEPLPFQVKVETHNHPTAISPFPGAATGSGGEIRDESATGRGARPKAGLTGFSVSHLDIPGLDLPWRREFGKPGRIASPLEIMIEGPVGGASFNNEFGRPALCGYFRSFEAEIGGRLWGYHKPIMVAGGLGAIRESQVEKLGLRPGAKIVVLGGPAMLIGLGGGAASSMGSGQGEESLDYASVQRGNPEMQRRCQEVIDACWALGRDNPILSVHDVGAGGLSNAIPELLHDGGRGAALELREIPSADSGMSPMEIWCNEAQERYVLSVLPGAIERFEALCRRERCPYAILGESGEDQRLVLDDSLLGSRPVEMDLDVLLGKPPRLQRDARRAAVIADRLDMSGGEAPGQFARHLERVLRFPSVGSKSFLVTIGDRTVGGLSVRDQMVGPWQVPVADAAVTLSGFLSHTGEAMAMGERTPLAVLNAAASARMAVAEAVTNIASAPIRSISDIRLSANWMAAAGEIGQDAALFEAVRAVGMELCPELGIAIPVGKDSLSMKTLWRQDGEDRLMLAPVSLIVSAFAPVYDVERCLTPLLQLDAGPTRLLMIDLGGGRNRLGGSSLAQANGQFGDEVPNVEDAQLLRGFFAAIQTLNADGRILAYHDRSDGGLIVSLLEMAICAHCGLDLECAASEQDPLPFWFSEEAGAVIQVAESELKAVLSTLAQHGLESCVADLGSPIAEPRLRLRLATGSGGAHLDLAMTDLQRHWMENSHAIQRLRDNPQTADSERSLALDWSNPGLSTELTFDPGQGACPPKAAGLARPRVAILREQGVNGQIEMAAAFDLAGFEAIDVHMSDLQTGRHDLAAFSGFAACGGFSYGDVLGAGQGWAKSILFSQRLRHMFAAFLADDSKFALGVCNGCQMLAALAELIPGAARWPGFVANTSEQFEARLGVVRIEPSPSLFFAGMEGSRLPVAVAHGEGRADFLDADPPDEEVCLRFVDDSGNPAVHYPSNPNGSPGGITGLTNEDGRVTILMPHPERTLRRVNFSWAPPAWPDPSPWRRMFENARRWVN